MLCDHSRRPERGDGVAGDEENIPAVGDRGVERAAVHVELRVASAGADARRVLVAVVGEVDDVAEHLRTPEEMAAYLEACLDEAKGDAAFIAKALGDIARARGMTQVARDTGLSRESLYKALSGERSPDFDTILKVVSALGIRLHAEATQR